MINQIEQRIPCFKLFGKTWNKPKQAHVVISILVCTAIFIALMPKSLFGDIGQYYIDQHPHAEPDIYFGAGIHLQISESEIATVFGNDDCGNQKSNKLLGESISEKGCTLLTGKSHVEVRLLLRDGSVLNEKWPVTEGVGQRVRVERPNGWIIREPRV